MCCQKNDEPLLIKENHGIVEALWKSIKGGRETIGYVLFDPFKQLLVQNAFENIISFFPIADGICFEFATYIIKVAFLSPCRYFVMNISFGILAFRGIG